jgi:hypothetical protein
MSGGKREPGEREEFQRWWLWTGHLWESCARLVFEGIEECCITLISPTWHTCSLARPQILKRIRIRWASIHASSIPFIRYTGVVISLLIHQSARVWGIHYVMFPPFTLYLSLLNLSYSYLQNPQGHSIRSHESDHERRAQKARISRLATQQEGWRWSWR